MYQKASDGIYDGLTRLVRERKNLLLMGRPGIGKTTVIRQVVDQLKGYRVDGFYTEEIRENGVRKGFLIRTLSGESRVLSHVDCQSSVRVGRYGVDLDAIESVINPTVERALSTADLLILDEIGKMETASRNFREVVQRAFDSRPRVIATVPVYRLPFVDQLKKRSDASLAEVTHKNRDAWPRAILAALSS